MTEVVDADRVSAPRSWPSTRPRTGVDGGTPAIVLEVSENEPLSVSSTALPKKGNATMSKSCSALIFPKFGTGLSFPKTQKDCTADRSKHGDGSSALARSSVLALFALSWC